MKITVLDGHTLNPGDNPWDPVSALGEFAVVRQNARRPDLGAGRGRRRDFDQQSAADGRDVCPATQPALRVGYGPLGTTSSMWKLRAPAPSQCQTSQCTALIQSPNTPWPCCWSYATTSVATTLRSHRGGWAESGYWCFWETPLTELAGKTIGLVGFGRIGQRVGELAHAFGMEVWAYAPSPKDPPGYAPFALKSMEEIFAGADVVSLHCPQTPDNTGFVNARIVGDHERRGTLHQHVARRTRR